MRRCAGSSFRPVGVVGPTVHKRVAASVQALDSTRRHALEGEEVERLLAELESGAEAAQAPEGVAA